MCIYKSSLHSEQRFNFVCDIFHSQNIYIELILNQKYVFGMNYQSELSLWAKIILSLHSNKLRLRNLTCQGHTIIHSKSLADDLGPKSLWLCRPQPYPSWKLLRRPWAAMWISSQRVNKIHGEWEGCKVFHNGNGFIDYGVIKTKRGKNNWTLSLLDPAANAYVKQIWGMHGKILYLEAASLLESKTLRSG